jgi:hypothetical protein
MKECFHFKERSILYAHGHAMHFVAQYLRIHSSRQKPLFQSNQTLRNQPVHKLLLANENAPFSLSSSDLVRLELLMLQTSVLSLVLKIAL